MEPCEEYENLLKGRFAEAVVEAIFRGSEISYERTGYECIPPAMRNETLLGESPDLLPDFKIWWTKDGKRQEERIEVKYRTNGKLSPEDIERFLLQRSPTVILLRLERPTSPNNNGHLCVIKPPYKSRSHGFHFSEPLSAQPWGVNPTVLARCETIASLIGYWHWGL